MLDGNEVERFEMGEKFLWVMIFSENHVYHLRFSQKQAYKLFEQKKFNIKNC